MTAKDSRPTGPADQPEDDNDTEGHSALMGELGRTIARDRQREVEQAVREARLHEEAKGKRGRSFFRR